MHIAQSTKAIADLLLVERYIYWLQFCPDLPVDVTCSSVICPLTNVCYASVAEKSRPDHKIVFLQVKWSLGTLTFMTVCGTHTAATLDDKAKDLILRSVLSVLSFRDTELATEE